MEDLTIKEVRQLLEKVLEKDHNFWSEVEHNWPKSCNSFCCGQTQGQRIRNVIDYIFRHRLEQEFYKWLNEEWQTLYQPHMD